jgi:predicted transcriptional regulator
MRVGDVCTRSVVHCSRNASALEVAKMMRDDNIGNVVVVDDRDGQKVPIGVVTDRDIVVQLVAKEIDPGDIMVTDLMARELFVALEEEDIHACATAARGGFRSLIEKGH